METYTYCESCHNAHTKILCDDCGKDITGEIPLVLSYQDDFERNTYHFCSFKHLAKFANRQAKHDRPDIITGETK